jgi:acetyl esterase/lipase
MVDDEDGDVCTPVSSNAARYAWVVISAQAEQLWDAFRKAPKQIELDLPARRLAGEQAEAPTSEPVGVTVVPEAAVDGLWVVPAAPRARAAILYLFGGGYVLGSPSSRRKTAGHLANAAGMRVLVPNYRLAPEHPFPAAIDDAADAFEFLLTRDVDADRTFVAGDSSGGGLALALLLALRAHGAPPPAGAVAMSPWADLTCTGASMTSRADSDIMCTRDGLTGMAAQYLAGHDLRDPLVSPVFGDLSDLPSLLLLVGGCETLLDDSVRVVTAAGVHGTDAQLVIGAGMQHVWPTWVGALPEADAAVRSIGDWITQRSPAT